MLMSISAFYWLLLAIICVIIECLTLGLTSIWFAGAALVTALISLTGVSIITQFAIFVLISGVLLCATKPLKKKFNSNIEKTNLDVLIGKTGIVVEPISPNIPGRIKIEGKLWTAISDEKLLKDERAEVKEIKGVTLLLKKED